MLKLFDKNHNAIGHLVKYKDCKKESDVSTGDATLFFTYLEKNNHLETEMYIQTREDEYVIKEVSESSDGFPQIVAVLNLEDLEAKPWQEFSVTDATIDEAARVALAGTGWTIGKCDVTKRRNAGMVQMASLGVIQNLCTAFMCEVVFDTIEKKVSFYEKRGEDKGVYFLTGLNLKKLQKKSSSYDFYTRIIPIGADGLTIEEANGGKDYLENHQYSDKIKTYIWQDESYTDVQALKEDAELKLKDLSKPEKSFSAQVRDLARQKPEYSVLSYRLGDTIKIIDPGTGTMEDQRIVRMTEYEDDPEKNTCEIANTFLTFEEMQQKLRDAAAIVSHTISSDGKIKVSDILKFEQGIADSPIVSDMAGNITTMQGDLAAVKTKIGQIETNYLKADEASIKYATIENLSAVNETVHSIQGDYADFKTLTAQEIAATNARIDNINAGTVTTEYLKANYASIDLANVETASVGELLARTGVLTDMTVVDGYVTGQLNGVRINADVITAGTLSVDRLMVTGEDSIVYQINVASSGLSMEELADEKYQKYLNGTDIVAASITGDRIAGNTITGNHIIANSIHGDRILAGSITGDRIEANAITAREINVTDLFAQDITATGTIRGVTLEGAKGMIGGWNIEKNCLYTDGSVALPNYSKTIVLQNPRKNLFANASISAAGCTASLIKNSTVRITATQDGAGSVKIELPKIPPGEYVVEFLTNYGGNGLLSDRGELRIGWYIPNSGNLADETGWELLSEAGLAERNVRKFTIPDQNGRIQALRLTYIMSKMRSGEEYELTFQITVDDEELYGEASIVEDVPSNAVLCIRDTVNRKNSIPFYLDDDGNIYCGTMRSYSGNIGPFRYNGERIKSVFTLETLGTSGTAGKTTDYTIDINSYGFLNPSDRPINIYYTENAGSKNDLFYVTAEGNVFAKGGFSISTVGGIWISGKTATNCIYSSTQQTTNQYYPMMRINTASGHVWNIGGIGDKVGMYGYHQSLTGNGTTWNTEWDVGTGHLRHTGSFEVKEIDTESIFTSNWFRSRGNTGWYSQSYGGGWWMTDSTWIRSYGDKSIYQNTGIMRTDGIFQVGGNGAYFNASSAGASFGVDLTMGSHNIVFNDVYGIRSGGHWVIRRYVTSADNTTICTGVGSTGVTLRLFTANSRVWLHNTTTTYFATTSTSDRRLKKDFSEITEAYERMYMDVDTFAFRYILNDKEVHYGFMAQDVAAALKKYSLTDASSLYGVYTAENTEAAVIHDTNVYHVNYLEWVPLNKHMITKTIRRLDMLEADTETKLNILSSKTDSTQCRLAEVTEELARMQAENQVIKTELEQLKQQRVSVA